MSTNLGSLVKHTVQPFVSELLINKESFETCNQVASHFPSNGIFMCGFECRLGTDSADADFLFCVNKHSGRNLAWTCDDRDESALIPKPFKSNAIWEKIGVFGQSWVDDRDTLSREVDNIWFEFDCADNVDLNLPIPSFFFGPVNTFTDSPAELQRVFATVQKLLGIGNDAPGVASLFEKVATELPAGSRVFQIGTMLSRLKAPSRICIRDLDGAQICEYLKALDWKGNVDLVRLELEAVLGLTKEIRLNLDVYESLGTKVGIECYFSHEDEGKSVRQFLAHLSDKNLCTEEKMKAVLEYSGVYSNVTDGNWPAHLQLGTQLTQFKNISAILRGINHIKLVFDTECMIEAKIYLKVQPIWLSKAEFMQMRREIQVNPNNQST